MNEKCDSFVQTSTRGAGGESSTPITDVQIASSTAVSPMLTRFAISALRSLVPSSSFADRKPSAVEAARSPSAPRYASTASLA